MQHGYTQNKTKWMQLRALPHPHTIQELKAYLGNSHLLWQLFVQSSHNPAPFCMNVNENGGKIKIRLLIASKRLLTSASFLTHFDPSEKLMVAHNASSYGVGAVLSRKLKDGTEKSIRYESRTVTKYERIIHNWKRSMHIWD